MDTLKEIEAAIQELPPEALEQLRTWLQEHRKVDPEAWLKQAKGAARPEVTTDGIIALTRAEEE